METRANSQSPRTRRRSVGSPSSRTRPSIQPQPSGGTSRQTTSNIEEQEKLAAIITHIVQEETNDQIPRIVNFLTGKMSAHTLDVLETKYAKYYEEGSYPSDLPEKIRKLAIPFYTFLISIQKTWSNERIDKALQAVKDKVPDDFENKWDDLYREELEIKEFRYKKKQNITMINKIGFNRKDCTKLEKNHPDIFQDLLSDIYNYQEKHPDITFATDHDPALCKKLANTIQRAHICLDIAKDRIRSENTDYLSCDTDTLLSELEKVGLNKAIIAKVAGMADYQTIEYSGKTLKLHQGGTTPFNGVLQAIQAYREDPTDDNRQAVIGKLHSLRELTKKEKISCNITLILGPTPKSRTHRTSQ